MSKSKLIETISNLSEEEAAAISKILGVRAEPAPKEAEPAKTNSKRKQRRKSEQQELDVKPRKKVEIVRDEDDLDEDDDDSTVNTANLPGRARRVKTRKEAQSERRGQRKGSGIPGRRGKGAPARTEAVDLRGGRPNRFEKMAAFGAEKGDTKIDALLNKGRRPTERRDAVQFVEVECTRCGDIWEVPPTFVYNDDEGNNFICDSCRGRGAK